MMRLTVDNIKFVKVHDYNGMPYSWMVVMKSGRVSDSRNYVNYENNKTVVKEYPQEWLPKAVQKFIEDAAEELINSTEDKDGNEYTEWKFERV